MLPLRDQNIFAQQSEIVKKDIQNKPDNLGSELGPT
jgi:hypothetical protein